MNRFYGDGFSNYICLGELCSDTSKWIISDIVAIVKLLVRE